MDQIEAETRQLEVKHLHEASGFQFVADKQIAEHADALPGEHCVYRMQLLAKVQVVHFAGVRHIPPSASGDREPSLPCRGVRDKRRPVEVDENLTAKVRRSLEWTSTGK